MILENKRFALFLDRNAFCWFHLQRFDRFIAIYFLWFSVAINWNTNETSKISVIRN
jgi:hypothetical protein